MFDSADIYLLLRLVSLLLVCLQFLIHAVYACLKLESVSLQGEILAYHTLYLFHLRCKCLFPVIQHWHHFMSEPPRAAATVVSGSKLDVLLLLVWMYTANWRSRLMQSGIVEVLVLFAFLTYRSMICLHLAKESRLVQSHGLAISNVRLGFTIHD